MTRVSYQVVMPGETYESQRPDSDDGKLVVDADYPNAFFCHLDTRAGYHGTIVIPAVPLRRIWDGNLYNRAVSNELVTQGVYGQQPGILKNQELIADCFADAWVTNAYGRGYRTRRPASRPTGTEQPIRDATSDQIRSTISRA